MDRFGIVAIREDLTVEHLKDGPLPCEDGLEALCQAVLAAGGVEPHIGYGRVEVCVGQLWEFSDSSSAAGKHV